MNSIIVAFAAGTVCGLVMALYASVLARRWAKEVVIKTMASPTLRLRLTESDDRKENDMKPILKESNQVDSCDFCASQEGRHYCLLHSCQIENMDTVKCVDWEPMDSPLLTMLQNDSRKAALESTE